MEILKDSSRKPAADSKSSRSQIGYNFYSEVAACFEISSQLSQKASICERDAAAEEHQNKNHINFEEISGYWHCSLNRADIRTMKKQKENIECSANSARAASCLFIMSGKGRHTI